MESHGFEYDGMLSERLTLKTGTSFPGSPATGELFYRSDHKAIYQYDGTNWRVMGVTEAASAPAFAQVGGELYYNTSTNKLYYWNNTSWVSLDVSPDASNTTKGITKLSVAAGDPANPIAVGTNDPRMLTSVQKIDLTDGGSTTLHTHNTYDSGWFTLDTTTNNNVNKTHNLGTMFPQILLFVANFSFGGKTYYIDMQTNMYGDSLQYNGATICFKDSNTIAVCGSNSRIVHGTYCIATDGTRADVSNITSVLARVILSAGVS